MWNVKERYNKKIYSIGIHWEMKKWMKSREREENFDIVEKKSCLGKQ